MPSKTFKNTGKYLHIPICDCHPKDGFYIKVFDGERFAGEFMMGIARKNVDRNFYVALYLGNYMEKEIRLLCEEQASDSVFDGIIYGDEPEKETALYPELYREPTRQQIHFSSRVGWLNDPNGCFYKDGKFNLYFQHNPFASRHGEVNVSWGHAVSEDGVHFREYPDAIMPYSSRCLVASGSACVDTENISGFGKSTILAAYTALQASQFKGRPQVTQNEGQMLLYSLDGGMSFKYFDKNPIITVPDNEQWRDPKIFTYNGKLCTIVYERINGEDCASFYVSHNCRDWELVSRTADIYECPDLFPLTVCETGEELWVLYGGNGKYSVGSFENYKFIPKESGHYLDYGATLYAGQTFNNHPDKACRYHIGWLKEYWQSCRVPEDAVFPGIGFNQGMSLVCKLTLHKTSKGYRLFREPNENYNVLRRQKENITLSSSQILDCPAEYIFRIPKNKSFSVEIRSYGFSYNADEHKISSYQGKEYEVCSDTDIEIRMLTDRKSVEFFVCGEISLSYFANVTKEPLSFDGIDGVDCVKYKLSSIWESNEA